MLFLAWLAVSFLAVAAINLYLRYFGLPRRHLTSAVDGRAYYDRSATVGTTSTYLSPGSTSSTGGGFASFFSSAFGGTGIGGSGSETVRWINSLLTWVWQRSPAGGMRLEIVDTWLHALGDEADRQARDVQLRFDGVRGSVPEFSNILVDPQSTLPNADTLTLNGMVTAKDLTLQVCALIHGAMSSSTVYCDAYILHLRGQLKMVCRPMNNDLNAFISFQSTPDIRLQILPSGRLDASIDVNSIEKAVRVALSGAVTSLTWSSRGTFRGDQQQQQTPMRVDSQRGITSSGVGQMNQSFSNMTSQQIQQQQQQQFNDPQRRLTPVMGQHSLQQQQQQQFGNIGSNVDAFHNQYGNVAQQQSLQQQRILKLLVKIIKANGLGDGDFGSNCNSYCVLKVDQPAQNYMTNVMRNTVNPLWDEQFIVDVTDNTRQIQLEVLDRDKPADSELLGRVAVLVDEIRRMQSGRQILPLTGRARSRTATSGSITVEFLFTDSMDASGGMMRSATPIQQQQQQQQMLQQQQQQSPSMMSYNDQMGRTGDMTSSTTRASYGQFQGRLSAHDLALNQNMQQQQQQQAGRPYDSPTLVVTGAEMQNQMQQQGMMTMRGGSVEMNRGREKKESFATTLKKRLTLGGTKKRSQSAERSPYGTQSLREGTLLRPPVTGSGIQQQTTNFGTEQIVYSVEYRVR